MPGMNLTHSEAEQRARLISNVSYKVAIDLTKGADTFGSVSEVSFDAQAGASTFLDLVAPRVLSVTFNGRSLDPAQVFKDSRIQLDHLEAHNTVRVEALGAYSHTGEGLHRAVDPSDGRVYLYTQFEVADARRMYANFEQPDLKATFDFTIDAPSSWVVLSTMPNAKKATLADRSVDEGTLSDGTDTVTRWEFPTTPKMSTYLTALIAGPYAQWHDSYANEDGRTVPLGLYCRQSLKQGLDNDAQYLFDITKKGFAFYNKQWDVPYPYAKYDQIFVPEYNAGAMENIGTVTIVDSYVFQSKVTDALADRRVETVLHELAHMWFGDLVTMKWWNDLWLNESFAEFMSTLCTAEATEWTSEWSTFTSGEKSWGQAADQRPTTHPVAATIDSLSDVEGNFDGITYAKGGSILKQLMVYVGRKNFFAGIHNYLMKHKYSNATLHDLLTELAATSGRDLDRWSKLWLQTAGVNTLTADVTTDANGAITNFTIAQSATKDYPTLRPHRMGIGFYNLDSDGVVRRSSKVELDVEGEKTVVSELIGKTRPDFILLNDDDLTYAKLRFDKDSLAFLCDHLADFEDPLARATAWLALWDMTRDGELPAEQFLTTSLAALATEKQSTTFRYALAHVAQTINGYVDPARREQLASMTADSLHQLAQKAEAGSDEQFQLANAWLGMGEGDAFAASAKALLDGDKTIVPGLAIDNDEQWTILKALARVGAISADQIDEHLAKNNSTANVEQAYGAKALIPTADAKKWAWDEALSGKLTNAQMRQAADGFSGTAVPSLYTDYVSKYFDTLDWIWQNRSFHMAEDLITGRPNGLYPVHADTTALVKAGRAWLDAHQDAVWGLKRMVLDKQDEAERMLRVQQYNASLAR